MIGRGVMVLALVLAGGAALAQSPGQTPPPAGTRISNATRGGMQDRSAHSPAEALFVEKCGMCHRQMGMGTVILARRMDPAMAMLELRHDLSVDYVTAAARGGIGNMPRIQRGEVSDAQLQVIARYLAKVVP